MSKYHPTIVRYDPYYGYQDWVYVLDVESLDLQYIGRNEIRENLTDWYVLGPMYILIVLADGSYRISGLQYPQITTNPAPVERRDGNEYYAFWHQETQGGTPIEVPDEQKEQLVLGALKAVQEGTLDGLSEASIDELQKEAAWLRRKPLITMRAMLKRDDKAKKGGRRKTRGRKRRTIRKR